MPRCVAAVATTPRVKVRSSLPTQAPATHITRPAYPPELGFPFWRQIRHQPEGNDPQSTPVQRTISGPELRRLEDIRDLLPDVDNPTPLVRVRNSVRAADVYLELEWFNPFGSIKDRAASYLIRGLLEDGRLEDHETVEASSGNTAIALVAIGILSGKKVTVPIPDGVPEETKMLLQMLGSQVWETPDELCPVDHPRDGAIALARSLEASDGGSRYVMPDQYENPDNVRAHFETTGPEIWKQTDGKVSAFFAGFGTCRTITGVGRYLKQQNPAVKIIAIEPQKGHRLPGLKSFAEANEPGNLDRGVIDDVVTVSDDAAYR